ncbi:hypothetical protein PTI98_008148 [Pleurotus ostreatus]|nr:hypothetical protein PTI98_008148 [Pleurotus ostreatus]
MTTAYSAFFASGLLAPSCHTTGSEFSDAVKSNQICIDETRLMSTAPGTGSFTSYTRLDMVTHPMSSSSSSGSEGSSAPSPSTRHRRRRSSLSAAMSLSFSGVKPSARDATSAAVRCFATAFAASSSSSRRTNGGSISSIKCESEHGVRIPDASMPGDLPKHNKMPRRSTVSAAHSPVRIKRSDRRGPSPAPPPSSPLPPLPSLPGVAQ